MGDWQLITVLGLIAGAALFLAVRIALFFRVRSRNSSVCGGGCHGCAPGAPAETVPLDLPGSVREAP